MMPSFDYSRPRRLDDALAQLDGSTTRVLAGGTDLLGCLRDQVFEATKLVSLGGIARLRGIRETPEGGLVIGATTPVADLVASEPVAARYQALREAAAVVSSPQLRNQGTVGGNLCQRPRCWYFRGDFHCLRKGGGECFAAQGQNQYHAIFGGDGCFVVHPSDLAPALVALGAKLRLVSQKKGERVLPVERFFVGPAEDIERETRLEAGEVLTEIELPPASPTRTSSYRKVRARRAWDFALVGLAVALERRDDVVEQARLVLSGVAPVPWRLEAVEKRLVGARLTPERIAEVARLAVEAAEPLGHNGYKVTLARGLLEAQLGAMAEQRA